MVRLLKFFDAPGSPCSDKALAKIGMKAIVHTCPAYSLQSSPYNVVAAYYSPIPMSMRRELDVVKKSCRSDILNELEPRLSEDAWREFCRVIDSPPAEPPPKLVERLKRHAPWERDAQ
jgi:hypothetical protein